ncbi:MAG: hypothetical protein IJY53_08660 [Akkermansia sp.]|nr:hypothetical protein [Akkermansia sp.]
MSTIRDLSRKRTKGLLLLDNVCIFLLLSLITLAWYCSKLQNNTLIEDSTSVGYALLLFILFGYTLCGFLFLCTTIQENRFVRTMIWGSIQIISALPMAEFVAILFIPIWGNDGIGLGLVILSPIIAICSFLLSFFFSSYFKNETVENVIYARFWCSLILLFWNIYICSKIIL